MSIDTRNPYKELFDFSVNHTMKDVPEELREALQSKLSLETAPAEVLGQFIKAVDDCRNEGLDDDAIKAKIEAGDLGVVQLTVLPVNSAAGQAFLRMVGDKLEDDLETNYPIVAFPPDQTMWLSRNGERLEADWDELNGYANRDVEAYEAFVEQEFSPYNNPELINRFKLVVEPFVQQYLHGVPAGIDVQEVRDYVIGNLGILHFLDFAYCVAKGAPEQRFLFGLKRIIAEGDKDDRANSITLRNMIHMTEAEYAETEFDRMLNLLHRHMLEAAADKSDVKSLEDFKPGMHSLRKDFDKYQAKGYSVEFFALLILQIFANSQFGDKVPTTQAELDELEARLCSELIELRHGRL